MAVSSRKQIFTTVLDIGSSKIVCMIARLEPLLEGGVLSARNCKLKIVGFGIQKTEGIKSGVVTDIAKAQQAIRSAVGKAESMSGLVVESVIVNFSGGRFKNVSSSAEVQLAGEPVTEEDMEKALNKVVAKHHRSLQPVLHAFPLSYRLDSASGISNPVGMLGERLGVSAQLLTANVTILQNIEACVNQAHLSVEGMVATPLASGLAALVGDEMQLGVACIDVGAGTTSFSIFSQGKFVYADSIPLGGRHITLDIAKVLATSELVAEELKVRFGSVFPWDREDRRKIPLSSGGEAQCSRAMLNAIVTARAQEILEKLRERFHASGCGYLIGRKIVMVGGGSQLLGFPDLAEKILGRSVRCGRPLGVSGLPDRANGVAFCTAVGLLAYPQFSSVAGSTNLPYEESFFK